ncbi:MAG: hypothetical protein JST58_09905 [Bacteroidetes bacterium]|nr:hypothetical protein [Bacteroidota bacterium]
MKTIILANHKTKERVVCQIGLREEIRGLMKDLNEKLGGNWVYIQDLKPYQVVPFEAAKPYLGFDNNSENDYCGNLINLKP